MKKLCALLALLTLQTSVNAYIYEDNKTTYITDGISHQSVDTFYGTEWVKADIVRVDLTNPDLSLKVLTSPNGTSTLSTVKTMAEANSTSVAVNADFFNMQSGETNMLGMVYQDGQLISTPSKDNFVSFAVDENNRVIFDYFTFKGTLYAEATSLTENSSFDLYQINKVPVTTGEITMITSAWGKSVQIPKSTYAMACEPYDEDRYIMTASSWGSEALAIPENGAVFIANYHVNSFLNANFAIGDIIRVETEISPDVASIKEASGGNTVLLKDSQIVPFTSDITGKAQRSAMGLSPSGKTLVLVTIDGRETECPGFTQTQLAEFMLALGCSDAINLDGGGSTTLVYPDLYTGEQTIKNSVSVPRKVSTAIGVISSASVGETYDGYMKLSSDTIILGDSVTVTPTFTDSSNNRVDFDLSDVTFSSSDMYTIVDSNRIMPTLPGVHTIYAEFDGIIIQKDILVLGDIFAINIYPESADVTSSDKTFSVTAYDKNGHSAPIPPHLLTFTSTGEVSVEGNKVLKGEGSGTITAVYENLTSSACVNAPIHEREVDIRDTDVFEGDLENSVKITLTGAISEPKNLLGRFLVKDRLSDLALRPDVYLLSKDFYDPEGTLQVYKPVNGFTHKTIEDTRIVTFANDLLSIHKSEENAWGNLKIIFDSMTESNLLLLTNEPVYNLNANERRVWDYFMDMLIEKGVNVFVVSTGVKSEVTVENGVRYLYVGNLNYYKSAGYDYALNSSAPLTFSFSGSDIRYTFENPTEELNIE